MSHVSLLANNGPNDWKHLSEKLKSQAYRTQRQLNTMTTKSQAITNDPEP